MHPAAISQMERSALQRADKVRFAARARTRAIVISVAVFYARVCTVRARVGKRGTACVQRVWRCSAKVSVNRVEGYLEMKRKSFFIWGEKSANYCRCFSVSNNFLCNQFKIIWSLLFYTIYRFLLDRKYFYGSNCQIVLLSSMTLK